MSKPTLNACLRTKRIYLNRISITALGDPSHLSFKYDEKERLLYVSATCKEDLDAFEIPQYFWKSSGSCVVARIAFLKALQYRLNWEVNSRYSYAGTLIEQEGYPIITFNMNGGDKIKVIPKHNEARLHCGSERGFAKVGDSGLP